MSNLPLVSILIVTWNRSAELTKALNSAFRQRYEHCEVIVVDNGSKDSTGVIVRNEFPEAKLIQIPTNIGCPSGRNYGISYCKGKYIYLLDDDGELDENAIIEAVNRAESDESLGVISSAIYEKNNNSIRIRPGGDKPTYRASFVGCSALLRSDAIKNAGLFPEDFFRQGEEEDLAIRLLNSGWFCFFEPKSIMFHSPSTVGRNLELNDYYSIRNATRTGLRLWPFPHSIKRVFIHIIQSTRFLFKYWDIRTFKQLIIDLFYEIRFLKIKRKPVDHGVLRLYRRLLRHPSIAKPINRK